MNIDNVRKVPSDTPIAFIKPRGAKLVVTDEGIDRRDYELCVLSELRNALRSGDVWVQRSRQYKDFDEYLVPVDKFTTLKLANELPLAVPTDCNQHSYNRMVAGTAAYNCQPDGGGQRPTGCHHHRVRPENHATGRGGAGLRTSPDRPVGDAATALQDHRTADGDR